MDQDWSLAEVRRSTQLELRQSKVCLHLEDPGILRQSKVCLHVEDPGILWKHGLEF